LPADNPLLEYIKNIISCKGPITFAEFMDIALYHKQWGYYTQNVHLGRQGDFYTSPHVSPVFGRMLARQLHEMWTIAGEPKGWVLMECGPGEGILSRDILIALKEEFPAFFKSVDYRALETSETMAARQKELLKKSGLQSVHVSWVKNIEEISPNPFQGCVFSNELIDAFPVHLVKQTAAGLRELYITVHNGELSFVTGELSTTKIKEYFTSQGITLEQEQRAEVNLEAINWLHKVAKFIARGFVITIDYGMGAGELYSPARFDGTLRCFFRHRLITSPLENIGKQDITANVNFTALEKWGEKAGLVSLGTVSQSQFLINLGILEELRPEREFSYDPVRIKKTMAIKQLIMPEGMGRIFKVLIQYKGFDSPPKLSGIGPAKGI